MKVLHLSTHLNTGGITTYLDALIEPLGKLGVETHIISSGGEWKKRLIGHGAKVTDLPIKTKFEFHPKVFRAVSQIKSYIEENKIDILHAHSRVTQVLAALTTYQIKIPRVSTCHGFYKRRLGRFIFPAWGDRVIAISPLVELHLKNDFKIAGSRIEMIFNGVNLSLLDQSFLAHTSDEVKRAYGFQAADPVIGIVARLVLDKGHRDLLHAVKLLKKDFSSIRCLIVGDGRERQRLESLTNQLDLKSNVCFTGNVEDVTRPLSAMDLFVFPPTWREGFGLSVVEAMACRKPLVTTDIWALNTLITHEENGLLVPPKSPELLAAAIKRLLLESALREKLTANARRQVEKDFPIERVARQMHALYHNLAGRRT